MLLSYIVTVYNKAGYLEKCLDSLVSNSKSDKYEIIVVDDGSTDGSAKICDDYAAKYSSLRVIHKENAGVSAARNTGILAAKGEWITILDGDDYIKQNSYDKLKKAIEKYGNRADLIYFNGYGEKNGHIFKNNFFLKEDIDYTDRKDEVIESAVTIGILPKGYKHYYSLGAPYCKIIRKSFLIDNNAFFDTNVKFAEDTLFSVNLIDKAQGIFYYDAYLYFYSLNLDSVTRRFRPGLSSDMDLFFSRLKDTLNLKNRRIRRAYYTRAFLELQKCVRNEFYNKKNRIKLKEKRKATNAFLSHEPYKTAIVMFSKDKSFMTRAKAFFFVYRLYWLYIKIYSVLKKVL